MRVARFLVFASVVTFLLSLSAALPRGVYRNPLKDVELNYTVYDYNRPEGSMFTAQGEFHRFSVAKDAIDRIVKRGNDWCGLGIKFRTDGVAFSWTPQQRKEFDDMMYNSSCEFRESQGFYKPGGPTRRLDVSTASYEDNLASVHIIAGLSVALSCICLSFVILIVGFSIKACEKNKKPLPTPITPTGSESSLNEQNEQSIA